MISVLSSEIDLSGFEKFLTHQNKAEGTIKNYLYEIRKVPASEQDLYLLKNKNKPLLIFSWRNYLKYQRSIGNITAEDLLIQLEIYKPPKRKGKTQKHIWYNKDQWHSIMEKVPTRVGKICVYIQFNFGLRIGELVNLRIEDIDTEKRFIHVQIRPGWSPKYARERSIPMTNTQKRLLIRWIENIPSHITHNYLLFNSRGDRLTERTVQRWYSTVGLKSHDLRRSFAKVFYYKTEDVKFVSKLLGHANIATTSEYLDLDSKEMQEIYEKAMSSMS